MQPSPKGTPELEALIGFVILSQCKIDALIIILKQKDVLISIEEIDNKCQSIYFSEFTERRQKIIDTMTNPDIRSTLNET